MRGVEICERLDARYGAHRRALYGALGVDAKVVRLGALGGEEPWPAPKQQPGAPRIPTVTYSIELLLESWVVVRAGDHPTYGLRRLSEPADTGHAVWHVGVYLWSAEEQRRDGRPRDRLWPLGFENRTPIGSTEQTDATNLTLSVIAALARV